MNKPISHVLSLILGLITGFCAPLSVLAYDFQSDGLCYNILSETDRTVEVTYKGFLSSIQAGYVSGKLEIPPMVIHDSKSYSVMQVGRAAFSYCSGLTSVAIPNSVKAIRSDAFSYCTGMAAVKIGNSVTEIEQDAFRGSNSLSTVEIPNSVEVIGRYAFQKCSSLSTVIIGNSVATIGRGVFKECTGLTNIQVSKDNHDYSSIDGVLYNKDASMLICCPGAKKTVTIPSSVTKIGEYAFEDCRGLSMVTIPNSVTTIESHAFYKCSGLMSVIIPASVTNIGENAFSNCSCLTSLIIPNSVISIGRHAFAYCSGLTSVTIPASVESFGENVFYGCSSMIDINVDKRNKTLCSIDGILYNKDASSLFYCPSVKKTVTIPNSVTRIANWAFYECRYLTTVIIPNSVTMIEERAFFKCDGLTSVTIGNSVKNIGERAFSNCSSLTSVTIGNSVNTIYEEAFVWDNIATVYCKATNPPLCKSKHMGSYFKGTLYVPIGSKRYYEEKNPWQYFQNIVEMDFSGIEDTDADYENFQISITDGMLTISGIGDSEAVIIYDMRGRMVYSGRGHVVFGLVPGIYVAKIGHRTAKFTL